MSGTPVDELNRPELDRALEQEVFDKYRPAGSPTTHVDSADIWHARDAEKQIEKLGLVDEYVHALFEMLCPDYIIVDELGYDDLWRFIHASPQERCRAALTAVRKARDPS